MKKPTKVGVARQANGSKYGAWRASVRKWAWLLTCPRDGVCDPVSCGFCARYVARNCRYCPLRRADRRCNEIGSLWRNANHELKVICYDDSVPDLRPHTRALFNKIVSLEPKDDRKKK